MRLLPILAVAVAAAFAGVPAAGAQPAASVSTPVRARPELWRGARVGMTLEAVQELFPKGRPGAGAPLVSGATALWAMDDEVYGRPGVATFYFLAGRLNAVLVDLNEIKTRSTSENFHAARELRTALSGYYGTPKECVDISKHGLDRLGCRWTYNGVLVGLSYLDFGGKSAVLDIAIRQPPPRPATNTAPFSPKGRRL